MLFQDFQSSKEREWRWTAAVRSIMCHSNVNGITHTHTHSGIHAESLTVCEPWRQEHFRAGPCSGGARPPLWVIRGAARPPPRQPWIYARKRELDDSWQICAFGSEHNYVSEPSKREGKMHTRTQTHTFLHTHPQSPSFYKNKANIRCCLFSMFYCWAMLGRSFVQSTSILIILVFYFSIISKEML